MITNHFLRYGIGLLLVLALASCVSTQRRERGRSSKPVWSTSTLKRHLEAFNKEPGERVTGSRTYRRAAKYVTARLREYEIQPAFEGRFMIPYAASLDSAYVLKVSSSSGPFVAGVDVLRHAQTGEGRVTAQTASIVPRGVIPASVRRLVLTPPEGGASLRKLRQAGARVVLQVGPLVPRKHRSPISDLVVAQITPRAALRLLGLKRDQLTRYLTDDEPTTWGLPASVGVTVRAEQRALETEAVNVLGYVAGRQPNYIDEAVLVCADLDVLGGVGDVATRDFRSFGVGAASMLETVRNVARVAPVARAMERSLIVAFWSGSQQGHQGLRAYLQDPLWAVDTTRAVYYVGLSPKEEPVVRALVENYGMKLHPVRLSGGPLFAPSRYLAPSAKRRDQAVEAPDTPHPNRDAIIKRGAGRARRLSEVTFQVLLKALSGPEPFMPARPDTLALPRLLDVPPDE